jgi:hypothetical protein
MKKVTAFFAVFLVILVMTSVTMSAGSLTIWSQQWSQDTSPVTTIKIFNMTGEFGSPATSGFGPSWTVNEVNPSYVLATSSPASVGGGYTINFATPVSQQTIIDVLEYNGDVLQEHLRFIWMADNPGLFSNHFDQWSWNQPNGSFIDPSLAGVSYNETPEPGTLVLMGAGLAGLGVWRRQRQQQTT